MFYCNIVNISVANATDFIVLRSGGRAIQPLKARAALIVSKLSQEKQHFVGDAPGLSCRFFVQDHKSRSRILGGKATGGLDKRASSKHHPVWYKTQSLGHRAPSNQ